LDQPVLRLPKSEKIQRFTIEADPHLILQLSRVGNNLNQLARAVNKAGLELQDITTVLTFLSKISADITAIREQAMTQAKDADMSDQGVKFGTR
ncbi:plasmid mobilization relaxosome protein MobC, partial [Arthrospira platensis SPKY2]